MNRLLLAGVLVVLVASACREEDRTSASGTIEFTQTDVAGSVPARIVRVSGLTSR